jgi:hypothetical protein
MMMEQRTIRHVHVYTRGRERERGKASGADLSLTSAGWLRENSRRRWPSHQHKKETKLGVYSVVGVQASVEREREDGTTFLLDFRFLFFF